MLSKFLWGIALRPVRKQLFQLSKLARNLTGGKSPQPVDNAVKSSLSRRDEKIARFYEQGASKRRIGLYIAVWLGWATVIATSVTHADYWSFCDRRDVNNAGSSDYYGCTTSHPASRLSCFPWVRCRNTNPRAFAQFNFVNPTNRSDPNGYFYIGSWGGTTL